MSNDDRSAQAVPAVGSPVERVVRPCVEALKQERAALRRLTYRTDAITARLETIHRELERSQWTQ